MIYILASVFISLTYLSSFRVFVSASISSVTRARSAMPL
jgi:hypothetical protein